MHLYKIFLSLFSRPVFFPLWMLVRKLSAHGLNMAGASRLSCRESGEQISLRYALNKLSRDDKAVVFDVGANVGQYASMCREELLRLGMSADIYSFEPTMAAAAALRNQFQSNPEVHVHQLAVGKESGETIIYLPWDQCAGASSNPHTVELWPSYNGTLTQEKVKVTTIDDILERKGIARIGLLKIDVEGMDFDVIEGARKTLSQGKVEFIQFEISAATMLNHNSLYDFWVELSKNYRFHLVMNRGLVELKQYSAHLENFVGASNFLLELKR